MRYRDVSTVATKRPESEPLAMLLNTQVLGNDWPEFENPPTDRLIADRQSALGQKILDIPVA
jgi:hypothetical protein